MHNLNILELEPDGNPEIYASIMDKIEINLDDFFSTPVAGCAQVAQTFNMPASQTLTSQRISIRIPHDVLASLKDEANARGFPYQTLINLILAEYAAGRLNIWTDGVSEGGIP